MIFLKNLWLECTLIMLNYDVQMIALCLNSYMGSLHFITKFIGQVAMKYPIGPNLYM